ncbi:hypothetical protein ABL78_4666 [Leptomonas seymouri]|uniref:Uncharacterized protein n=1 Tax=Leptomonas seymouri TaxID=5684 RepID=A0A0N1PCW7_LEPSE|nr:hypothetical protein ABL78_4666 [Leptomonas seymouri]|eukprot:KPI86283.1 hypothetical protein ABL78_4666 [Leptomonas seymouri]
MSLPQLRSTTPAERECVSLSSPSLPRLQRPPPVPVFSPVNAMQHLPILTATSLRPARPSRATHSKLPPAKQTADGEASEEQHPLLSKLLSESPVVWAQRSVCPQPSEAQTPLPTLEDAVEEVGGADKVEALLQQLKDLPHRQEHEEEMEPFSNMQDAVQQCVLHVLNIPDGTVCVSHPEDDPSVLHVQVPLPEPTKPKKGKAVAARPFLVLRVHRQRGVLSLHVINLCYQGPDPRAGSRATRRRRESPVLKRENNKQQKSVQSSATAVKSHAMLPPLRKDTSVPTVPASGDTERLPSSVPDNALDHSQLLAALSRPSEAVGKPSATVASSLRTAPSRPPSSTAPAGTGSSRRAKNARRVSKLHNSTQRSHTRGGTAEFDPLRPEETTPFDAQHRPLTFNAAIVFS